MKDKRLDSIPLPLPLFREAKVATKIRRYAERQTRRYRQRLEVRDLNGAPAENTFILDISPSGARLETSRPLALHDLVELTCALPAQGLERRLAGKVMWVKGVPPLGQRYWVGLKFFTTQWDIAMLARQWESEARRK